MVIRLLRLLRLLIVPFYVLLIPPPTDHDLARIDRGLPPIDRLFPRIVRCRPPTDWRHDNHQDCRS